MTAFTELGRPLAPRERQRAASALAAVLSAVPVVASAASLSGAAPQDSTGSVFHDGSALPRGDDYGGTARFLPLYGNPSVAGESFAFRLEITGRFEIGPHTHPVAEHITVLSGTLNIGIGAVEDVVTPYGAGSYVVIGTDVPAYMWSDSGTVIQVHGIGPFHTSFVGPPTVEERESGVRDVLQAVSPVTADTAWVSGHGGIILRTADGGETWERLNAPGSDSLQFRDVHAFSWMSAVAMSAGSGAMSRIYRTDDAGENWTRSFLMDEPEGFLNCLDFWDSERGFAYGDSFDGAPYVLVTEDGGQIWQRVPHESLPPSNAGEGGFAASGTCARVGDGGNGWIGTGAAGSARLLTTSDYGSSWSATDLPLARGGMAGTFTLAVDGDAGMMAFGGDLSRAEDGDDGVVNNAAVSSDGGVSWKATVPVPLPGAIYGSAFGGPSGSRRVVVVSPLGAAYSHDSGASWHRVALLGAWAVAFAPDGLTGWAVGADGRTWRLGF